MNRRVLEVKVSKRKSLVYVEEKNGKHYVGDREIMPEIVGVPVIYSRATRLNECDSEPRSLRTSPRDFISEAVRHIMKKAGGVGRADGFKILEDVIETSISRGHILNNDYSHEGIHISALIQLCKCHYKKSKNL